ncbi:MAG: undecaprenyldiphospho-muramoylpentapeptide beta-N-acetylglucosaminyltransferase [Bacteroidota bacterium]
MSIKVIISGGGTGGHVYPAIAIAKAVKEKEPTADILFVGAQDKLEMEKVPKAGFPIKGLWISGFHRKLTLRNLMFPFKLIHSLLKSRAIIRRFKPDVAVGVGGFASGPLLEMASRSGVPSMIQEQNSYAGITNKLLAKKVHKICVAYPEMERFFPKEKLILTGNPVRKDILNPEAKKTEALMHFSLPVDAKTIFITGGSLGAQSINEAIAEQIDLFKSADVQVIWQAGKLYVDRFRSLVEDASNIQIMAFVDRMDLAYAAADLVVCRAGASTISELCLAGKPSILVPSPNVAEDHQTKNAMALVKVDAAQMVKDASAKAELVPQALDLLADISKQAALTKAILTLGKPNAASDIADIVIHLAKKTNQ